MRAVLAAVLLAAACGSAPPPVAAPKVGPPVAREDAVKGASDAVTSIYESLGHGDSDGLMTLASAKLVVFGPRRGDALANRSDALVALAKVVSRQAKASLASSALQVVPSAGGHSAWAFDVVEIQGEPMAALAVLENNDDIWLVEAATLGRTPTAKLAAKELAADAVVPPGMSGVAAKVDAAADGAAEKFRRGLGEQATWGDELAARGDALVVGPRAGEVTHGKADVKKLWKKRLKVNTHEALAGELTGATTPDGKLAWITAPVTRTADGAAVLPLRVFAVYARSGDDWKLVALQETVALAEPGAALAMLKKAPAATAARATVAAADGDAPAVPAKAKKPRKAKKKARAVEAEADAPAEAPKPAVASTDEDDAPVVVKHPKKAKKPPKKKPVVADDDDGAGSD